MGLITIDGLDVTSGTIFVPRRGAWHADVLVDSEDALDNSVTVDIGGQLQLTGTVLRSLAYAGMAQVRLVGGGGGMATLAAPKFYSAASIKEILSDLASGAGEAVSDTSDSGALGTLLPTWTTLGLTTGTIINNLVAQAPAGTVWRLLPDGTIWVGPETWPDSGIEEWREITEDGYDAAVEIGLDVPVLVPGTMLGDRKIDYVEHIITSESVRSLAWEVP